MSRGGFTQRQNVLITGGSRGLGAATAHAFAMESTSILGNDISDEASPANVVVDISEKYGVRVGIVQGDIGLEENWVRIVNNCIALFGGVMLLFPMLCAQ